MRADIVTFYLLNNTTAIKDELSGIYLFVVPDAVSVASGTFATYTVVRTDAITTKTSHNTYDRAMVQISLFGSDLNAVNNVADIIRIELDRYSGTVTVGGVDYIVDLIQFENREDLGFVEAERVFMVAMDFRLSLVL
jgi:hypothetical protein